MEASLFYRSWDAFTHDPLCKYVGLLQLGDWRHSLRRTDYLTAYYIAIWTDSFVECMFTAIVHSSTLLMAFIALLIEVSKEI